MGLAALALLAVALPALVSSHGHITIPASTRANGSISLGGNCENWACFWFSQIVEIPHAPTLNESSARTYNVDVADGSARDYTKDMPWRSPGSAPVLGSGCGVAGGSSKYLPNGGIPPPGIAQGADALDVLPAKEPVEWRRGSEQEVAWAFMANHGGGYSYRLCKNVPGKVTEECFQRTPLPFAGSKQWIRFTPIVQYDKSRTVPDFELPRVTVSQGTFPHGSQWARNPIPGCLLCSQADCMANKSWDYQQQCSQSCSGLNITTCPLGMTQFPEPASGLSGYYMHHAYNGDGLEGYPYSIVDKVVIPEHLETGHYLLSWRWDCEQSRQIWQNCADIVIS